jgi:hypothetical protein
MMICQAGHSHALSDCMRKKWILLITMHNLRISQPICLRTYTGTEKIFEGGFSTLTRITASLFLLENMP